MKIRNSSFIMRIVDEIEIDVKTGFFFYINRLIEHDSSRYRYCNKHDNLTIYIRVGKVQ